MSQEYFTTDKAIIEYIGSLTDHYTSETIRTWLKDFKIHIYCGALGHRNPACYLKLKTKLHLSNELKYIFELLYIYLKSNAYLNIKFPYSEGSPHSPNNFTYNAATKAIYEWRVPSAFAPFLVTCVLATKDINGKMVPVCEFFGRMDNRFDSIVSELQKSQSLFDIDSTKEKYRSWKENFLGQSYFETLEAMYNELAINQEQQQAISDATIGLTYTLLESSAADDMSFSYFTEILKNYQKQLEEKIKINSQGKEQLFLLYPHVEPLVLPEVQQGFISASCKDMELAITDVLSYIISNIESHHKQDSRYELAIDNFASFSEKMESQITHIQECAKQAPLVLQSNINAFLQEPENVQAVARGRLIVDSTKISDWVTQFEKDIKRYRDSTVDSLRKFTRMVNHSSGDTPEKYKSIKVNSSYIKSLEEDIQKLQENLEENCEKHMSSFLALHQPGYLNELKYPVGIITPTKSFPTNPK